MHISVNDSGTGVWFFCPHCGKRLFRYLPETRFYRLPAWCRGCHREIIVTRDAAAAEAGA